MKLFLVLFTFFFLSLMAGSENRQVTLQCETCPEIVARQTQLEAYFPDDLVNPGWLRSYLFMLHILEPSKQLDLPVDHEKNGHGLSGKIIRSVHNTTFAPGQQIFRFSKYWRLLSARHINGFYIYSLEKLLI